METIWTKAAMQVDTDGGFVVIFDGNEECELPADEAIAAARAILKHFNATLESDQ